MSEDFPAPEVIPPQEELAEKSWQNPDTATQTDGRREPDYTRDWNEAHGEKDFRDKAAVREDAADVLETLAPPKDETVISRESARQRVDEAIDSNEYLRGHEVATSWGNGSGPRERLESGLWLPYSPDSMYAGETARRVREGAEWYTERKDRAAEWADFLDQHPITNEAYEEYNSVEALVHLEDKIGRLQEEIESFDAALENLTAKDAVRIIRGGLYGKIEAGGVTLEIFTAHDFYDGDTQVALEGQGITGSDDQKAVIENERAKINQLLANEATTLGDIARYQKEFTKKWDPQYAEVRYDLKHYSGILEAIKSQGSSEEATE